MSAVELSTWQRETLRRVLAAGGERGCAKPSGVHRTTMMALYEAGLVTQTLAGWRVTSLGRAALDTPPVGGTAAGEEA